MPSRLTWRREGTRRPFRYYDAKGNRVRDRRDDRAPRRARDPARVEGRVDRGDAAREAPGDGHRQRRPQAVPLPRRVPRAAGGREVRGADPVRGEAARAARRDGRAPDARPARPVARLRGRDPADQPRVVPHRLRAAHASARERTASRRSTSRTCKVRGNRVTFRFRAKGKVQVRTAVVDVELADSIRALLDTPGQTAVPLRDRGRALQPQRAAGSTSTCTSSWARASRARTSAPGAAR